MVNGSDALYASPIKKDTCNVSILQYLVRIYRFYLTKIYCVMVLNIQLNIIF
jgi:hypothetical protein